MYIFLVLQNVVTLSVNLADNMMLGFYGETALSGVTTVNQIQFFFQQITMALGEGVVILGGQYWGKREPGSAKQVLAASLRWALVLAALLFCIVSLFPEQTVGIFTEDEAIRAEGAGYLKVIRFSYLFFAVTQILLAAFRSVRVMKIAFYLSIMTFFVNCGLNALFIFGNLGFPEMGAKGAAVGTLIARMLETAVLIGYLLRNREKLPFSLVDFRKTSWVMALDYGRVVVPMLVVQGLWGVNTAMQTVILGHMDTASIAANSAASSLFLLVKSTAVGASAAASVMISTAIGRGDMKAVKDYARKLQRSFLVIGCLSGILLYFLRLPILSVYRLSGEAMELADEFLVILSVVCVGMSYQMPVNGGIIRGGGSTSYTMVLDLISIWGIVLPLSFFMAFVVKAPAPAVVCCLNADQIFKCITAFWKVNYGRWIRQLTPSEAC